MDALADTAARRILEAVRRQGLQRDTALDEPGLQDLHQALHTVFVVRVQNEIGPVQVHFADAPFEIETLVDLLHGLIDRVSDLVQVCGRSDIK